MGTIALVLFFFVWRSAFRNTMLSPTSSQTYPTDWTIEEQYHTDTSSFLPPPPVRTCAFSRAWLAPRCALPSPSAGVQEMTGSWYQARLRYAGYMCKYMFTFRWIYSLNGVFISAWSVTLIMKGAWLPTNWSSPCRQCCQACRKHCTSKLGKDIEKKTIQSDNGSEWNKVTDKGEG